LIIDSEGLHWPEDPLFPLAPAAYCDIHPAAAQVRQGYNLIHRMKSGMTYWAVSDLNLAELQQFAGELQNQ